MGTIQSCAILPYVISTYVISRNVVWFSVHYRTYTISCRMRGKMWKEMDYAGHSLS